MTHKHSCALLLLAALWLHQACAADPPQPMSSSRMRCGSATKTLTLVKSGEKWLIRREHSEP